MLPSILAKQLEKGVGDYILFYDLSRRKFKKLLEGDEELPFIALFRKRKIIIRSEFEEYMKKNPEIMEDLKNGKRIS